MAKRLKGLPEFAGVEIAQAFNCGGDNKKEVLARYTSSPWNFSRTKVYDIARDYGWKSGRKPRTDKGVCKSGLKEDDFKLFAKILLTTTRWKMKKRLIPTRELKQLLVMNGYSQFASVSESTINRWLRRLELDHEQLVSDGPASSMRATHPNHIHFVDASICVQYDFDDKKKLVTRDMKKAFYKNKPGYWKTVKKVIIRWMLVDVCSGVFYVHYTYAGGENKIDLLDFLLSAWLKKPYASKYPFQGVPDILGMDPGAANLSHEVSNLLAKLEIDKYVHKPGNSRASGVVEVMHSIWERNFEYELLLKLADNLEDLNSRAQDKMIYMNAVLRHNRTGMTRNNKWMEINKDQLRVLPGKEYCQLLATSKPVEREPDARLRISFEGKEFKLQAPAIRGRKVTVEHNPWHINELIVKNEYGELIPCQLIEKDQHGFDKDAPVYGENVYKTHQETRGEKIRKEMESTAKTETINGVVPKLMSELVPEQTFMPKRGTPVFQDNLPKLPPIKKGDVAKKLRDELNLTRLTPMMNQQLKQWLNSKDLITMEEFQAIKNKAINKWKIPTKNETTLSTLKFMEH